MTSFTPLAAHILHITGSAEFRKLVQAHASGHYESLTIIGPPGVGKSEIVMREMQAVHGTGRWGLLRGRTTSLELYCQLFKFRLDPLVLDDLDGLLAKPENTALLKAVCDTRPIKRVEWRSKQRCFSDDLPKQFDSISRVCLIANELSHTNKNVAALLDRGLAVNFQPSALEVHREVANGGWFDDAEVFEFIGRHLQLVGTPSFRFYVTASQHRRAGLDWQDMILRTIETSTDPALLLVISLAADSTFDRLPAPEAAREREFRRRSGLSRATYYRYKNALQSSLGKTDREAVRAIRLGPRKADLLAVSQAEHREHLENLRDELNDSQINADSSEIEWVKNKLEDQANATAELERRLRDAVQREDFETAAKLRDELRRLRDTS
jgi:hypothetical protein